MKALGYLPVICYHTRPNHIFCTQYRPMKRPKFLNVLCSTFVMTNIKSLQLGPQCGVVGSGAGSIVNMPRYFTTRSKLPFGATSFLQRFSTGTDRRKSNIWNVKIPHGKTTGVMVSSEVNYKRAFSTNSSSTKFGIDQSKEIKNHSVTNVLEETVKGNLDGDCLYFHPSCKPETRAAVTSSFAVHNDYLSEDEEKTLMKEVEPHLKRLKYEFDHWDDAIHGFRETERSRWGKASTEILTRVRRQVFPDTDKQLPQTHVLDLAETGVIKPHVDSVRFCGNIICGLCLLSDAVMRLVHVEQKDQVVDVLLKRRSLYIMKDESRFRYTHEVLREKESFFGTEPVPRHRRVSLICRNSPRPEDAL